MVGGGLVCLVKAKRQPLIVVVTAKVRVRGSLLSWMQEKTAPVFVVTTANDVTQLPPELLRAGPTTRLIVEPSPPTSTSPSLIGVFR